MKKLIIISCLLCLWIYCPSKSAESVSQSISNALETEQQLELKPEQLYEFARILLQQNFLHKTYNHQEWGIWAYDKRYKDLLKTPDDTDKAIQTMVSSLGDRYTRYLPVKEYKEEMQAINAKLEGIGIQIGANKDKKIVVIAPIHNSPAMKAGLQSKDEIVEIDNKSISGLSVDEVASRIRGLPNTEVILKIKRNDQFKTFTVIRSEIKVESIPEKHYAKINDNICYIHLASFISQDAAKEFIKRLDSLGSCPSLILDLRNNPGGLLFNAIFMSGIFLEEGADIVSTVDRDGYIETQVANNILNKHYDGVLVLLVNNASASASEILSGALQDNDRAILVGDTTFGKGLVQAVKEMPNGAGLNITTAKYLTPNGSDIHEKGIKPNYEIKLTEEQVEKDKAGPWFNDYDNILENQVNMDKDIQLQKAISIITEKLTSS